MLAGVDEVGRGPLAGPVVAAAVILKPENKIIGLMYSINLTAKRRVILSEQIWQQAQAVSVAEASVLEIDEINILQASLLAMQRAVNNLSVNPSEILVDGCHVFASSVPISAIIKGDQKIEAISAASIIAKVYRDNLMLKLDAQYPEYGFARHMGYPTAKHLQALAEFGACKLHRRSFAPVRKVLAFTKN